VRKLKKVALTLSVFILTLILPKSLGAQGYTIDTEIKQMQLEGTTQTETHPQEQNTSVEQVQPTETVVPVEQKNTQNSEVAPKDDGNVNDLGNQYADIFKANSWFAGWWKIGFWTSILWFFPWIFVGWQWRRRKFWGFGWPWPWWFWIPIFWFIPWLVVGWWQWLVWWPWWMWVWWMWPWIFWPIWWLIVFKEAMIWMWKRG